MPPFVSSFLTSADDVTKFDFEFSTLHFKYRILVKSTFVKRPIYIAKKVPHQSL